MRTTTKILGAAVLTVLLSGCSHHHAVYFNPGSAKLTKGSKEVLMGAAKESQCIFKDVTLTGFADKTGGKNSNIKLSDRRVASVKSELIALGVKPRKITMVPSDHTSIDNNKKLSQARRVEILIK